MDDRANIRRGPQAGLRPPPPRKKKRCEKHYSLGQEKKCDSIHPLHPTCLLRLSLCGLRTILLTH